eukprot:1301624-Pleurochrysis_carterae.AAC.3
MYFCCDRRTWPSSAVMSTSSRSWSLVLHVPTLSQIAGKIVVERPVTVGRVQREQVVNVAAKNDPLRNALDVALSDEHTRVGLTLFETPVAKPKEE